MVSAGRCCMAVLPFAAGTLATGGTGFDNADIFMTLAKAIDVSRAHTHTHTHTWPCMTLAKAIDVTCAHRMAVWDRQGWTEQRGLQEALLHAEERTKRRAYMCVCVCAHVCCVCVYTQIYLFILTVRILLTWFRNINW